mmetsp:Transcript_3443/g.8978  ORF Transcript_3443/g.8978 Transcript_3443/m.8978 type:complete len:208 (+) Transcript_3443:838-1461(+)
MLAHPLARGVRLSEAADRVDQVYQPDEDEQDEDGCRDLREVECLLLLRHAPTPDQDGLPQSRPEQDAGPDPARQHEQRCDQQGRQGHDALAALNDAFDRNLDVLDLLPDVAAEAQAHRRAQGADDELLDRLLEVHVPAAVDVALAHDEEVDPETERHGTQDQETEVHQVARAAPQQHDVGQGGDEGHDGAHHQGGPSPVEHGDVAHP